MIVPDWIREGAHVAVLDHRAGASKPRARILTIDRVNAKSVTVDGDRYPLDTLTRSLGTWDGNARLVDPNSDEVLALLREQRRKRLTRKATEALAVWEGDPSSANAAAALAAVTAVTPWLTAAPTYGGATEEGQ